MRILLAGATGVIGRRLAPLLVKAGYETFGTTRSKAKAPELKAARVARLGAEAARGGVWAGDGGRGAGGGWATGSFRGRARGATSRKAPARCTSRRRRARRWRRSRKGSRARTTPPSRTSTFRPPRPARSLAG